MGNANSARQEGMGVANIEKGLATIAKGTPGAVVETGKVIAGKDKPSDIFYPGNPGRRDDVKNLFNSCCNWVQEINATVAHLHAVRTPMETLVSQDGRMLGFATAGVTGLVQSWDLIQLNLPDKNEIAAQVAAMGSKMSFAQSFGVAFSFTMSLGISGMLSGQNEKETLNKYKAELTTCNAELTQLYDKIEANAITLNTAGSEATAVFAQTAALYAQNGINPGTVPVSFPAFNGADLDSLNTLVTAHDVFLSYPLIVTIQSHLAELRSLLRGGVDITTNPLYLKLESEITQLPKVTLTNIWKLLEQLNGTSLKNVEKLTPDMLTVLNGQITRLAANPNALFQAAPVAASIDVQPAGGAPAPK